MTADHRPQSVPRWRLLLGCFVLAVWGELLLTGVLFAAGGLTLRGAAVGAAVVVALVLLGALGFYLVGA